MCGIAGLLVSHGTDQPLLRQTVERMASTIAHRGPDDSGLWTDESCAVGLGFRRLSIVDLSELGHQPMISAAGRFVIVFNGEVYNHGRLRGELANHGHRFRGGSDTEVLLAAFEQWGVVEAVQKFIGMFAIALWDNELRELHLIRDRLGKKPLFFRADDSRMIFGSELKVLFAAGMESPELDIASLQQYLRYLYVPAPWSILKQVNKVSPGHVVTFSAKTPGAYREYPYWSLLEVARHEIGTRRAWSDGEALEEFVTLLGDAVGIRMRSDVPYGALLSGGIDSSLVTAVMQSQQSNPVETFCIGFDSATHDETQYARQVANHLGTNHHEMTVSGADALALVERLPDIADEPLADPSIIPTYLVSKFARSHVTVVLTGDGGDELFAGYNRQRLAVQMECLNRLPYSTRRVLSAALRLPARPATRVLGALLSTLAPSSSRGAPTSARVRKLADAIEADGLDKRYRGLLSAWIKPAAVLRSAPSERGDPILSAIEALDKGTALDRVLLADQISYLPDDLLAKVDRASMAVALEARTPLLDHRLVEFSWSLRPELKIRGRSSKWIMRAALERFLPPALFERPKVGFTVPLASWLLGPLREWSREHLHEASVGQDATFDAGALERAWTDLQDGRDDKSLALWSVLMLQAWRRRWGI